MKPIVALLTGAAMLSATACAADEGSDPGDRIERTAEASAAASGDAKVLLGLTEWQLLDAEIVDPRGAEIDDVERVMRDDSGMVDRLLVELEDSDPDRYVMIPVAGLKTVTRGHDVDLQANMARADAHALPPVDLSAM